MTMRTSQNKQAVNGVLLINKPDGLTSNAVLQRAKRRFNAKKAGHTGSLDPMATGMLPICFGEATKFSQYGLDADKTYLCTGRLGIKTNTGDKTGEPIATVEKVNVSKQELITVIQQFMGAGMQVPSMFSALKHQGRPLYALAREGISVERAARPIIIHQLELLDFDGLDFSLRVTCSKGTYIRNLVEDIGETLGSGAHVTVLHREYVGAFAKQKMYTLDELNDMCDEDLARILLPADVFICRLPKQTVNAEQLTALRQGKTVQLDHPVAESGEVRVYDCDDSFRGLALIEEGQVLKVKRLLGF